MTMVFSELRCKEVINIPDGKRLGYVTDLELDTENGRIVCLLVPCPCRFFGLFGSGGRYVIPWQCVRKIGDDLILVDICPAEARHPGEKPSRFS